MNGVAAMVAVLTANAALTAVVPEDRITAGVDLQGTALPKISVSRISATDLNIPSPGATRLVRELVQVTVLAADYVSQHRVLALVKAAAADRIGPAVSGITGVTIHTASAGPDFVDERTSIYIGTQDFAVIYNEET
jgi:hypothetical protein